VVVGIATCGITTWVVVGAVTDVPSVAPMMEEGGVVSGSDVVEGVTKSTASVVTGWSVYRGTRA
jgi:hypothetical protein